MGKIELKRFSNPGVLMQIQPEHLVRLADHFKDELLAKNCRLSCADPKSEAYCNWWAGMLSRPELLPDALVEAVSAMEEQVTAANWPRLNGAVFGARYAKLWLNTECSPESLALQLWLWCPYRPGGNMAEVQSKIDAGKKVWEEEQRVASENQAKLDAERNLKEGKGKVVDGGKGASPKTPSPLIPLPSPKMPSPLTPLPSDGRGLADGGEGKESKSSKWFGAILPSVNIDSDASLSTYFVEYQINWIQAEDAIHAQGKQAFALAEKSVRIGWTHCDSFKNVRKRLRFKERDYLFATKDYPSALEYMRQAHKFAELFNLTKAIVAKGEDYMKVPRLDKDNNPTAFTDEIKIGYIKFDNGSYIRAFSSHPQAMSVYGGDVGLDEFAKHPNAHLLWETAQGRATWAYDIAVWSAHAGEDTLFYQFARDARAGRGPWNLYYRVTLLNAVQMGLLKVINNVRDTKIPPEQFVADCESRAGLTEVFEQSYMCNPAPSAQGIVDWSSLQHCRYNYEIDRVHLEAAEIRKQFGAFRPTTQFERAHRIREFIHQRFLPLFQNAKKTYRAGFDVAASGDGDLMVIYIDELKGAEFWLRGLFTCRTDDWDFIKTVLFTFMQELPYMLAAGDETGLGQMICWEAANAFRDRFTCVNFSSMKSDIGFALMNQLSMAEKRFPRSQEDIAADYFALRKSFHGSKWIFSEGRNPNNPASHCDIAWAGGLATEANNNQSQGIGAMVGW